MPEFTNKIDFSSTAPDARVPLLYRQWLVTNGLGGYASGTLAGATTWRYHGVLIAALPVPLGRTVMLNHLDAWLIFPDGRQVQLAGANPEPGEKAGANYLREFQLENQIPRWRHEIDGLRVERRVLMPNLQNTVHLTFDVPAAARGTRLELRPSLHFRRLEESVNTPFEAPYEVRCRGSRLEIEAPGGIPPLRLYVVAPESRFVAEGGASREIFYSRDAERGLEARGALWSPGYFSMPVDHGPVTLIASTEEWLTLLALTPDDALATEEARVRRLLRKAGAATQSAPIASLVIAADQFVVAPKGRIKDSAVARAAGDELRTVIAGYHWFTDWGRDTMISLEGLTLATGRHQEAAWILHTFARAVRDGLIPNLFPEGESKGLYHTADATLWFFHAINRYVSVTGDREILVTLLPTLRDIIDHHLRGTKFGIGVDPADGLLRQGAEGYQLTWMDAKVGDWVVTPRRGKPVEINALWYNALKLMEGWAGGKPDAGEFAGHAARAAKSFQQRFWNPATQCLFDVVDGESGDDPAIRPNQLLAISLPHPVLAPERWAAVLQVVEADLLTPVGLRTLSPRHPDFKAKYTGDLRARDAAYHQGTVWPWLIGPFIDAWLKVHPGQRREARKFLDGFLPHFNDACVGSISEIFDAEPPYAARGCIAQAWSVAEVLRTLLLTATPDAEAPAQKPGG